jgi:hypothetical protein
VLLLPPDEEPSLLGHSKRDSRWTLEARVVEREEPRDVKQPEQRGGGRRWGGGTRRTRSRIVFSFFLRGNDGIFL